MRLAARSCARVRPLSAGATSREEHSALLTHAEAQIGRRMRSQPARTPTGIRGSRSRSLSACPTTLFERRAMFNKGLATVYILIYGSLLILSVIVTFTTNVGIWGVVAILGLGWLLWRQISYLSKTE